MKNKFELKYQLNLTLLTMTLTILTLLMSFVTKLLLFDFYYVFIIPAFLFYLMFTYTNIVINDSNYLILKNSIDAIQGKQEKIYLPDILKITSRNSKPVRDLIFEMRDNRKITYSSNISERQEKKMIKYISANYKEIRIIRLD